MGGLANNGRPMLWKTHIEFSFQVSIRLLTPAPELRLFNVPKHICGGIILDKTTILSAAHCFYGAKDGTGKQWAETHDFIIRASVIDKDSTKGQVSRSTTS